MKKLSFRYEVHYSFSQPVTDHCYALRILPETNEEQGIYASEYRISGGCSCDEPFARSAGTEGEDPQDVRIDWERVDAQHLVPGRDGFGNSLIAGRIAKEHDRFAFCVTGTAYTRREKLRKQASFCAPMYRYPTDLTRPGINVRSLYSSHKVRIRETAEASRMMPGGETWGRAVEWMRLVEQIMTYTPGVTGIHTTAEEALTGGNGVCQDYAHVLIALLRLDGIPARYIAGLLSGEGATHAWVEAWCEGWWVGLDPTHGCWLTDDYIEIARGRDYRDCIMDRGAFRGFAQQVQEVYSSVSEYEPKDVARFRIL